MNEMVIYRILNIVNMKKYVGCTSDIKRRMRYHKSKLKNGNHDNIFLQEDYNKYGEKSFVFSILQENVLASEVESAESSHIKLENSLIPFGYNMTFGGYGVKGYEYSDISKAKRSEVAMGNKNSRYGTVTKIGSTYFGVYRHSRKSVKYVYYMAKITTGGKCITIGEFKNEIDAAKAYDKVCWDIYNDISHLNFPEDFIQGAGNDRII